MPDPDLSEQNPSALHVLVLLEAAQRQIAEALRQALDPDAAEIGLRRLRILQLIPQAGIRQQALAERALVTKQAMAESVEVLQSAGWVERTPDPTDGRAWLVLRSARGDRVCAAMDEAMKHVEHALSREVGAERFALFRHVLTELGTDAR